ncbi:Panacea domain-containing protein [Acidithiobacillus thiooxidans]|uniref:Panacea domain-containing protein n=1 Tax=Acidithiobacillus thiooxidans TaxID=930 RepID=UPI00129DA760|nr:type II toxin-antitoxin system antitoxin SocA domain-containing protein [Acidithiobacillus thiooxidans]
MTPVLEVAKYFLSLDDEEAGDTMSNLKLQKLLYYAQGFHLAVFGVPLFEDEIEAWTHGPVVPNVYHEFKNYGGSAIPGQSGFDPTDFSEETRDFLNEVYNVYGQFSAWKLRNMTHEEDPWKNAYDSTPGTTISNDSLKTYFSTRIS